jgi:DNA-binding transcriptional MerR regulator
LTTAKNEGTGKMAKNARVIVKTQHLDGVIFTGEKIAEQVGRTKRTVKLWTDEGIIIPDVQPPQGRGVARLYSERNLIEFSMVDSLLDEGVNLSVIKVILAEARKYRDFYKDPAWGKDKDLIYIGDFRNPELGNFKATTYAYSDGLAEQVLDFKKSDSTVYRLILIAKVKNLALKRLGLTA